MRVIKRYSNRKLYDTETKQYITLEQIADFVRQGQEVQVLENTTGEDLTALTLSQIIHEQEKKQKGFLPRPVLNALVEAGGKPLSALRQRLESPLGFLRQVDIEIERRIEALVQGGELAEEHGRKLREQLINLTNFPRSLNWPRDDEIERALQNQEIPNGDDVHQLIEQIEELTEKLSTLENSD